MRIYRINSFSAHLLPEPHPQPVSPTPSLMPGARPHKKLQQPLGGEEGRWAPSLSPQHPFPGEVMRNWNR